MDSRASDFDKIFGHTWYIIFQRQKAFYGFSPGLMEIIYILLFSPAVYLPALSRESALEVVLLGINSVVYYTPN
jgi:hypothetical protein